MRRRPRRTSRKNVELDQAFADLLAKNPSLVRVKALEAFKDLGEPSLVVFGAGHAAKALAAQAVPTGFRVTVVGECA